MTTENPNSLSGMVIGAAIEVHKALGPGLLESAYEKCLCRELELRGVQFECQVPLPVRYKGEYLDCGYIQDIVIDRTVIVELKALDQVLPIHKSQLLTYLKLSDKWLGLLINFNVPILINGVERIVNGEPR